MNSLSPKMQYVAPVFLVADLARSIAFYRDQLAFTLEFEYGGFYASMMRDGCKVHLKCASAQKHNQAACEATEHIDACFGITNAAALSAEFSAAGVAFTVPLRAMPYGDEFYVGDPDGYILGFIQAR